MEAACNTDPEFACLQDVLTSSMQELWAGLQQLRAEVQVSSPQPMVNDEAGSTAGRLAEWPRMLMVRAKQRVLAVRIGQLASSVTAVEAPREVLD